MFDAFNRQVSNKNTARLKYEEGIKYCLYLEICFQYNCGLCGFFVCQPATNLNPVLTLHFLGSVQFLSYLMALS